MNITITDAAEAYIQNTLIKNVGKSFRLSIKKTGCSGYSYLPTLEENIKENDVPIQKNNLQIYIDPTWQHLLEGITVDYVEEQKNGLKQKRLIFINPNESNRCGCGESFHVE